MLAEVHTEVPRDDVFALVGLEVLMVAYVGEGALRIVEAHRIRRVEHSVVAIEVEEVTHTAWAIEEELRLPDAIRIP